MIKNVTQAACRAFTPDVGQMLIDSDGRHLEATSVTLSRQRI